MDNKDFLVELTERFTNTDSSCGTMTSRESQIMLIASEIYTEQVKNNDLLHNVSNRRELLIAFCKKKWVAMDII